MSQNVRLFSDLFPIEKILFCFSLHVKIIDSWKHFESNGEKSIFTFFVSFETSFKRESIETRNCNAFSPQIDILIIIENKKKNLKTFTFFSISSTSCIAISIRICLIGKYLHKISFFSIFYFQSLRNRCIASINRKNSNMSKWVVRRNFLWVF